MGQDLPLANDRFWREADIPTNGIKAVAAEPDEFADHGVVRELVDELGLDRRPLRHAVGGDPTIFRFAHSGFSRRSLRVSLGLPLDQAEARDRQRRTRGQG
jgi:hypothetical protein